MEKISLSIEQILDFSYDGIWIYDKNLNVIYVNKIACEYCNTDISVVMGKSFQWIYDNKYFFATAALKAYQTKQVVFEEAISKNGKHILLTSTPILDDSGQIKHVITNTRDISVLVELTNALSESKRRAAMQTQMIKQLVMDGTRQFIVASPQMIKISEIIDRIAQNNVTILLLGESGVGKDILAKLIHSKSPRAKKELVYINCGAIPSALLESELFGYEKGAFTGATVAKKGLFELADGSTLMLDEVGELELPMQTKLLHVLQEGKVRRVGGIKEFVVNVRIIAATNQDLRHHVEIKKFRKDLFYRLNVISIQIPPLRERPEDVKQLIPYLLARYNDKHGTSKAISPALLRQLEEYSWPGNVREMSNLIERLVLLCPGSMLTSEYLPKEMQEPHIHSVDDIMPLKKATADVERHVLALARKKYGNTRKMAKALQTSHATIARKLRQYGID